MAAPVPSQPAHANQPLYANKAPRPPFNSGGNKFRPVDVYNHATGGKRRPPFNLGEK